VGAYCPKYLGIKLPPVAWLDPRPNRFPHPHTNMAQKMRGDGEGESQSGSKRVSCPVLEWRVSH